MSHIFYRTFYHAIWGTKKRIELIDEHINNLLKEAIQEKIIGLKGKFIEFNSYIDHCHLLVTIPPKISVSDFVGQIKGFSSRQINKISGEDVIKWQRGFGVLTLSEKGVPFVRKYIQNQAQHHGDNSLIDLLEIVPTEDSSHKETQKETQEIMFAQG